MALLCLSGFDASGFFAQESIETQKTGLGAPVSLSFVDMNGRKVNVHCNFIRAIDAQGTSKRGQLSNPNTIQLHLDKGEYWIEVTEPGWTRLVRTISVSAQRHAADVTIQLQKDAGNGGEAIAYGTGLDGIEFIHSSADNAHHFPLAFALIDELTHNRITTAAVVVSANGRFLNEMMLSKGELALDLLAPSPVLVEMCAPGFVPLVVVLTQAERLDSGNVYLRRGIPVTVEVKRPDGIMLSAIGCEFRPMNGERYWNANRIDDNHFSLAAGLETYVVRAWAWDIEEKDLWCTEVKEFTAGEADLGITLCKTSALVLAPSRSRRRPIQIQVRSVSGLPVLTDNDYADIPRRLMLIPGRYSLHCLDVECDMLWVSHETDRGEVTLY